MCFVKLMEQLFCVKITVEKYRREHVKNMEVLGYYSTFLILEKQNKTKNNRLGIFFKCHPYLAFVLVFIPQSTLFLYLTTRLMISFGEASTPSSFYTCNLLI